MHIHFDEDEWESVTEVRPCTACNGDRRRCDGRCNGSFSSGLRRRSQAEVARIKAERRRADEDSILKKADAIRAHRAALRAKGGE